MNADSGYPRFLPIPPTPGLTILSAFFGFFLVRSHFHGRFLFFRHDPFLRLSGVALAPVLVFRSSHMDAVEGCHNLFDHGHFGLHNLVRFFHLARTVCVPGGFRLASSSSRSLARWARIASSPPSSSAAFAFAAWLRLRLWPWLRLRLWPWLRHPLLLWHRLPLLLWHRLPL